MSKEVECNCPPCDPGAPKWVTTFGDLMSLLLCFFVLLLSFSEMDKAKYKEVAGSMEKAFGVQRKIKTLQTPKGTKIIARDFDQSAIPTEPKDEIIKYAKKEDVVAEIENEVASGFENDAELIKAEMTEEGLRIRMMGETAFSSGSAALRPQMIPLLKRIARVLQHTEGEIVVSGHTDNIPVRGGRFKSNLHLSILRAYSVADLLLHYGGIEASRMATMGFGEYRPFATNLTENGRRKNRRVEITLRMPDQKPQTAERIEPDFQGY